MALFRTTRQFTHSWVSWIHSTLPKAIGFIIHFNSVIPSIPQSFKFSGSSDSLTKILMHFSRLQYPSHVFLFDNPFSNAWYRAQIKKLHYTVFSIVLTLSFYFQIFATSPCSRETSAYVIILMRQTKFHKKVRSTAFIIFDRIIVKYSVQAMKSYGGLEV